MPKVFIVICPYIVTKKRMLKLVPVFIVGKLLPQNLWINFCGRNQSFVQAFKNPDFFIFLCWN
ncbi:hypothetical protein RC52_09305 [Herbaspirillum rubrisubalbicans]|nr:hypothetical protein [Herbaspirillum rubrisubalbicans]